MAQNKFAAQRLNTSHKQKLQNSRGLPLGKVIVCMDLPVYINTPAALLQPVPCIAYRKDNAFLQGFTVLLRFWE